jgi:[acyl-carrier-protein] S-malonyltransferase
MTTAWVFPGQGSQVVGMGRELYDQSPAARKVYDEADAALGFSISSLCFDGPEEQLMATENAQPALLTTSYAFLAAAREHGEALILQEPAFVAGHSLGEYSALLAAGAFDLATAVRLVRRRGELMAAASAGGMAAIIGLDEAPLEALCQQVASEGTGDDWQVVIANFNSPGQLVISGGLPGVQRVSELAKAQGAKRVMPLKVSAADAPIADLKLPLLANVTADVRQSAASVREELAHQVASPVRWVASVEYMAQNGVDTFIEVGPGNVLANLIKRIAPTAQTISIRTLLEG